MTFHLFNSLSKQKEEFKPISQKLINMYTCGPTVYNYVHIGNFFAYLSADTLQRWLSFGESYSVNWALNLTDVDDKTIRDSIKKHPDLDPLQALKQFTAFYTDLFIQDLKTLNITHISTLPRAMDHIEEQKTLIQNLLDKNYAYISDGSVYFDIQSYKKDHTYGRLIHIDEGFQDGVRVDNDEYEKDSAADFVLWKGHKEGEPFWDADFNTQSLPGRPGWHLECSAMEEKLFGLPFDIHTGGLDLKFPHHENEIAQSHGGYGIDPTKYWVHNGFLQVEGSTMSKKKGNFFTLSQILEKGYSAESFRLTMVTNHYRKNFNFTENGLHASAKHIETIRAAFQKEVSSDTILENLETYKADFISAMQSDLNTPLAFSVFLNFIKSFAKNPTSHKETRDFFVFASNVFGVNFTQTVETQKIPAEITDLADKRIEAKKNKDFTLADQLRDQISNKGFLLKDTREGYVIEKK